MNFLIYRIHDLDLSLCRRIDGGDVKFTRTIYALLFTICIIICFIFLTLSVLHKQKLPPAPLKIKIIIREARKMEPCPHPPPSDPQNSIPRILNPIPQLTYMLAKINRIFWRSLFFPVLSHFFPAPGRHPGLMTSPPSLPIPGCSCRRVPRPAPSRPPGCPRGWPVQRA